MQVGSYHFFLDSFFRLLVEKKGCIYPEEIYNEIISGNDDILKNLCVESLLDELIECGFIEYKYATYYTVTKRGNLFHQFIEFQKLKLLKENVVSMRTNIKTQQSTKIISYAKINRKLNYLFVLFILFTITFFSLFLIYNWT